MYRNQYYKGQEIEYHWIDGDKTHFGEIIDVIKVHKEYGGIRITVLWDTGKQREYYGDNSMIILGKIKPVHKFLKDDPNRRFVEDGKKI